MWFVLVSCATTPEVVTPAPRPVSTPEAALAAFYDGYEVDLPQMPPGPPLPPTVQTVAFGSCLQPSREAPILDAVAASDPDLFVMLGDNVYGDARSGDVRLPELRAAYAKLAALPGFDTLATTVPLLTTWDDHDYGMNDAGASFSPRRFSERIFERFWRIPASSPRLTRPGVHGVATFGEGDQRVQVVLLDLRTFKSDFTPSPTRDQPGAERYVPTEGDDPTMMGADQWAWLRRALAKPAALRIVVSSLQVHADGHGWERWGLFPRERERLYEALAAREGGAVVIVSGDRHRAGLYERPDLAGGPYLEMTTSSLNLSFGGDEEAGPHRLGPTYTGENFGTLAIDWAAGTVALAVRDQTGTPVLERTASLSVPSSQSSGSPE